MNTKGQMQGMGQFLLLFIALVVGLSLLSGGIYENIGATTLTRTEVNDSLTVPTAGSSTNLKGQAAYSITVINATNGAVIPTSNYTVTNYQVVNGVLTSTFTNNEADNNGLTFNVTYTYEPDGYATSTGARSMINLIAIFSVLALVAAAIVVAVKNGGLDLIRR